MTPAKPDAEELISVFVLKIFAVLVIAACFALPGWAWVRGAFFPWEEFTDSAEYENREAGAFVVVCLLALLSSLKIVRLFTAYLTGRKPDPCQSDR